MNETTHAKTAAGTQTSIVTPGSLTDFAKALRELIAAFRDVAGVVNDGLGFRRRWKAGQAADDLDGISFPAGGFRRPLMKIASGTGSPSDVDDLEQLLHITAEKITVRIDALRKCRDDVRRTHGAAVGHSLSNIIDGPDGKFVIRYEIEGLISIIRNGCDIHRQQDQAGHILEMIDNFNANLVELHDMIFPPQQRPKPA